MKIYNSILKFFLSIPIVYASVLEKNSTCSCTEFLSESFLVCVYLGVKNKGVTICLGQFLLFICEEKIRAYPSIGYFLLTLYLRRKNKCNILLLCTDRCYAEITQSEQPRPSSVKEALRVHLLFLRSECACFPCAPTSMECSNALCTCSPFLSEQCWKKCFLNHVTQRVAGELVHETGDS
jgi:hypothetical protein